MSELKPIELKYAIQALDVLVEDKGTYRKKQAWGIVKEKLLAQGADSVKAIELLKEFQELLSEPVGADLGHFKARIDDFLNATPCHSEAKAEEKETEWCSKCKGRGYSITHQKDKETCEKCKGTGKVAP